MTSNFKLMFNRKNAERIHIFQATLSELFFSHFVESSQVLLGRPHLESTFFSRSLGESQFQNIIVKSLRNTALQQNPE